MRIEIAKHAAVTGVATAVVIAASAAPAATINLTTLNWAPYYGEKLKDGGPVAALAKAAAKVKGHSVTVTFQPWKRALVMAERGEHDGLLGAYYNEKRDKAFHFSFPFYSVTGSFIAKKGFELTSYDRLQDLKGYRIGHLRGSDFPDAYENAEFLNKRPGKNLTNLRKLNGGRLDLVAMADTVFFDLVKRKTDHSPDDYTVLTPPLWNKNLYIAISQKIPNARQITKDLNEGIRTIIKNGTYAEIVRSYGLKPNADALKMESPDTMN